MKCIQVLPILKHTFSEELTYWTTHDFSIGDLIQVELNHRKIYAIVSSIVSLSEAKEFIKSRDFKIKKIETYTKVDFFSNAFIRACLEVSTYYVRSFGEVLSEYIPKKVLEHLGEREIVTKTAKSPTENKKTVPTVYVQKQFSERIQYIKELQETKKSICIIVPTSAYKKHIENHVKDITILTPIDLYILDEKDFDVCILEYTGSEYYRHVRKGFDSRHMVRTYCSLRGLPLVEMDSILPIYKDISIEDIKTSKIKNTPEIHIIDQKISKTAKVPKQKSKKTVRPEDDVDVRNFMEGNVDIVTHKKLKLISPELYSLIVYAQKQKEDIFIYTTRKGLSSSVSCSDCGNVLTCEVCKKPFTLKSKKGITTYECPQGHTPISLDSLCPVCGGMHLQGLGSGTDALEAELKNVISMPIITIDGDTITQAGVRNVFKKRRDKNHLPTIYIGTELALHQGLEETFIYGAIASMETLIALPSSNAELEMARIVEAMREKITKTLVIQTRTLSHIVWRCVKEKKWNALTEEVQKDTKELNLPPFTTHIQVYISNQYKKAEQDVQTIQAYLQGYADLKPLYVHDDTRHVIHLYIGAWSTSRTYQALHRYLKSLPKHIRIEVDSPSLM